MKILIVTETIAGKGHEKAAKAIEKAIRSLSLTHDVKIVSLLAISSKIVEKTIGMIYMGMIKKTPFLWHWMYKRESNFAFLFKEIIARLIQFRIKKYINMENPDLVIATHAVGLGALSRLKEKHPFQLVAVFTDYQINKFWINRHINQYFVPHDDFKQILIKKYHIDPNKIKVSGIPIDPDFINGISKRKNKVENQEFNLLIMGGGLGIGGIKEIIISLNKINNIPLKLVVITGTNLKLYQELNAMKSGISVPMVVLTYTEEIYLLMNKSDLLITKPGGLTISEALSSKIPMLIYKPIPGQEEKNVNFLSGKEAAVKVNSPEELNYWVEHLYLNPKLYKHLQEVEGNIAKPESSIFISEVLLKEGMEDQFFAQK